MAEDKNTHSEIFDAARSNKLSPDQIIPYSESLERLRDTELGIKYNTERERKKALVEGGISHRCPDVEAPA